MESSVRGLRMSGGCREDVPSAMSRAREDIGCDYRVGEVVPPPCVAPIAYECFCDRCSSENARGTFHSCFEHREEASVAHLRIYGGAELSGESRWGSRFAVPRRILNRSTRTRQLAASQLRASLPTASIAVTGLPTATESIVVTRAGL